MATLNTELALVRRFHALLENYEARPAVARRNTLPTLSRFLRSKERQIRKLSLEAVYLLAEHPENLELLGNDENLVDGVAEIYDAAQYDDPELCELSSRTLDLLAPTFDGRDPRERLIIRRAELDSGATSPASYTERPAMLSHSKHYMELKELTNTLGEYDTILETGCVNERALDFDQTSAVSGGTGFDGASSSAPSTRRVADSVLRPSEVIRGAGKDCPLSILLEIPALDVMMDTSPIEEILNTTRGVISYTMTLSAHQIRVFLSAFAQAPLQTALTEAGYENVLASAERMAHLGSDGGNQSFNGSFFYDPDSRRPSYIQNAKKFATNLFRSIIVYSDPQNNSLAARVRHQRASQAEGGDTAADRLAQAFSRWW